ncbi:hypothetical protein ACFE04_017807 [Oxalis oulophora]
MEFKPGEAVEVCTQEEGYKGSYFAATVISRNKLDGSYLVQYHNLVDEKDKKSLLQEVIEGHELRPKPPRLRLPTAICQNFLVDAFENDAWWVGRIVGKEKRKLLVYFELYKSQVGYPIGQLRFHQEWIDGKWIVSQKSALNISS